MQLIAVYNVWQTDHPSILCVEIDQIIHGDNRITRDFYVLVEGDEFGLAPTIRDYLAQHSMPIRPWSECPINIPEEVIDEEINEAGSD